MGFLNKFPSFNFIYKNALATLVRFPFTILSAVLGAVVGIMLVESDKQSQEYVLQKLGMVAALGLPLFTALAFYADKKLWDRIKDYALQAAGAVLLAIYYFSLPENPESAHYHLQRFMLLNISFHFLVAFVPFMGSNQVQGFWQFNKSLFLRFLTAALYSAVLYIGLAIALLALDYLFGVDIIWKSYMKLWIVIAVVFQTWVFLAGVPANLNTLNDSQEYPKGLKILAQYILLPLVALYFLILITYEFKIIFEWNLPKGWVSQLVLWFSVVGILSLLLLHPLRERTESKWIKVFSKWFFRMLLPLLGMLFVAIWVRIADYGITEFRYYVMAMAIGLALVVFYFIFSKAKDIRIIPMVVFAIAMLSAFGPWGAFAVSKASQQNRMEAILIENEVLVDGKVAPVETELTFEGQKDLSSIASYLIETHGIKSFERWFDDSTLASLDTFVTNYQARELANLMGFEYVHYRYNSGGREWVFLDTEGEIATIITGYDYFLDFDRDNLNNNDYDYIYNFNDDTFQIKFSSEESILRLFSLNGQEQAGLIAEIELEAPVAALMKKYPSGKVAKDEFTFEHQSDMYKVRILFHHISGLKSDEKFEISSIECQILLRKR